MREYILPMGRPDLSSSSQKIRQGKNQLLTDTQLTTLSLGSVEGSELQECKLQREQVLDREERQSHKPLI